jgi:hypothetical protein
MIWITFFHFSINIQFMGVNLAQSPPTGIFKNSLGSITNGATTLSLFSISYFLTTATMAVKIIF